MAVSAMIDAGADKDVLLSVPDSIPEEGLKEELRRAIRNLLYGHDNSDSHQKEKPVPLENHFDNGDIDDEEELSENMQAIISHVEAHIHRLKKELGKTDKESDNGIPKKDDLLSKIDDVDLKIGDVFSKIDDVVSKIDEVDSKIGDVDLKIDDVFSKIHDVPDHNHVHGDYEKLNIQDVIAIMDKTSMTAGARRIAVRILEIMSAANADTRNGNHLHPDYTYTLESVADIIALAVCYDNISSRYGIRDAYFPVICEGTGTVRRRNVVMPVPVPATANIASEYGIPMRIINAEGELATPTGMAFVAAVGTRFCLPPAFRIVSSGMGVDRNESGVPNILRVMIIDTDCPVNSSKNQKKECSDVNCDENPENREGQIFQLEADMDDCPVEALEYVMEELLKAGAIDVHYVPCIVREKRPSHILSVVCAGDKVADMEYIIFRHTGTVGIRRMKIAISILPCRTIELESPYGKFRARESVHGNMRRIVPEYGDVSEICRRTGMSFIQIYSELQKLCRE